MTDKTGDGRESLINELLLCILEASGTGKSPREVKDALYILLDKYEITARSTSLAELSEDRNSCLLRNFLVAKTVKGCTEKTINAYQHELKRILDAIGKTVDEITADDIRYYLAIRQAHRKYVM